MRSLFCTFFICFLLDCNQLSQNIELEPYAINDTIHHSLMVIQETHPMNFNTDFSVEYPILDSNQNKNFYWLYQDSVMGALLQNRLDDKFKKFNSVEEMQDYYFESYNLSKKEFLDRNIDWFLNKYVNITANYKGILSLQIGEENFLGGAHGEHYLQLMCFDVKSPKKLKLSDLFTSDYLQVIETVGVKYFKEQQNIPDSITLYTAGYFHTEFTNLKDHRFYVNDNFYIDKTGITFHYNHYEIGPYVMGASKVKIPYKDLQSIIPENSILYQFIAKENL